MHYYNALLDNLISKDYRIEHDFLLFILEFLNTNTKSWRFDSIFRFDFRFNFWNRIELSISTLEIELPRLSIQFESNRQDSIRFLESNSISRIDAISLL